MIGKTYDFVAELDLQMVGTYRYHAIKIPVDVQERLVFIKGTKLRFEGELNGIAFKGALLPTGTGRFYVMVNESIRKQLKLELGDPVAVRITIVDPSHVDVPPDLEAVLDERADIKFKWDALTPGTKRGILHQIESAARAETRTERMRNLIDRLDQTQPHEPFNLRKRL